VHFSYEACSSTTPPNSNSSGVEIVPYHFINLITKRY
jgi:hypothetical protein